MEDNSNKGKEKNTVEMKDVQKGYFLSAAEINEIFDKVFKKCITLSSKAVVRMINGIFGTDHPDDSRLTYNWTEFIKDNKKLSNILADGIVTVNGEHAYHIEAQAYLDNEVVFRVFEYGYEHAKRNASRGKNRYIMKFPKPVVIYLYYESEVPDEYIIEYEFDDGDDLYEYKVPVIKLPKMSAQDMDSRNMVILIPFKLLKLREWVRLDSSDGGRKIMTRSPGELKSFIENDIIGTIDNNQAAGNITYADAVKLKKYTVILRDYICDHLGAEGLEEVRGMTDHSFMTDIDILCENYDNRIDALQKDIYDLQKDKDDLQKDNDDLQKDNDNLQKNNDNLQNKLREYKDKYGEL